MASLNLFDALEHAPVIEVHTTVYRHVSSGRDCRSGEGARAHGGRWNPPGSFPALYTALTPYVACRELARLASRQKVTVEDLLPRTLCVLELRLTRVVDLTTEGNLSLVGLSLDDITGDDPSRCRELGDVAHRMGFEGLLVPSATGAGYNFIVFPLNLASDSLIDERPAITWATLSDLPVG